MSRSPLLVGFGLVLILGLSTLSGCSDSTPTGPPPGGSPAPAAKPFYPGDPASKDNPAVQNQKK